MVFELKTARRHVRHFAVRWPEFDIAAASCKRPFPTGVVLFNLKTESIVSFRKLSETQAAKITPGLLSSYFVILYTFFSYLWRKSSDLCPMVGSSLQLDWLEKPYFYTWVTLPILASLYFPSQRFLPLEPSYPY